MEKTVINADMVMHRCAEFIAAQLHMPVEKIDPNAEFEDFGLDSALLTSMLIDLEEWLGVELSPSLVFEEPTLQRLGDAIVRHLDAA